MAARSGLCQMRIHVLDRFRLQVSDAARRRCWRSRTTAQVGQRLQCRFAARGRADQHQDGPQAGEDGAGPQRPCQPMLRCHGLAPRDQANRHRQDPCAPQNQADRAGQEARQHHHGHAHHDVAECHAHAVHPRARPWQDPGTEHGDGQQGQSPCPNPARTRPCHRRPRCRSARCTAMRLPMERSCQGPTRSAERKPSAAAPEMLPPERSLPADSTRLISAEGICSSNRPNSELARTRNKAANAPSSQGDCSVACRLAPAKPAAHAHRGVGARHRQDIGQREEESPPRLGLAADDHGGDDGDHRERAWCESEQQAEAKKQQCSPHGAQCC
ncbi:Uncharacterised protein [Pseudomonas aeruginosa]|nr:Uncharacterised protein [Pseudomonas aeruginosa]